MSKKFTYISMVNSDSSAAGMSIKSFASLAEAIAYNKEIYDGELAEDINLELSDCNFTSENGNFTIAYKSFDWCWGIINLIEVALCMDVPNPAFPAISLDIEYRSKEPCDQIPKIFSTGSYSVQTDDGIATFDFESTTYGTAFEKGFLFITAAQRDLDMTYGDGLNPYNLYEILKKAKWKDLDDVFRECYLKEDAVDEIELVPTKLTFWFKSELGFFSHTTLFPPSN